MSIASVSLYFILLNFGVSVLSFNDEKNQLVPLISGQVARIGSSFTQLAFSGKFGKQDGTLMAWLKINPIGTPGPAPVDMYCVVDVSTSMNADQSIKRDGKAVNTGLNTLDLVKHSLLTIIESMNENDKLTIITFSSEAKLRLATMPMNDNNKTNARNIVKSLAVEGKTDLWAGIKTGWDAVQANKTNTINIAGTVSSLFVFTDGVNNVNSEQKIPELMKLYSDKNGGQPCSINTFGFGYTLQSDLLDTIARQCNGSYVFIPDLGIVGTAFANATANLFTVVATDASIEIRRQSRYKIQVLGSYEVVEDNENDTLTIKVGDVRSEQSRDIILQIGEMANASGLPEVRLRYTGSNSTKVNSVLGAPTQVTVEGEFTFHIMRSRFVDALHSALKKFRKQNDNPNQEQFSREYQNILSALQCNGNDTKAVKLSEPLFLDVNAQVKLALEVVAYSKWGKHYLPSLCRAHGIQSCNNFKDKGVQVYGGNVFKKIREIINDIFNKPTEPKPRQQSSFSSATPPPPVVTMSSLNNAASACFHGDSTVYLANGSTKKASAIRKGDKVMTKDNGEATVLCVLITEIKQGSLGLVRFAEGVLVTPYHPFFFEETQTWEFPIEVLKKIEQVPCKEIFSYLLSDNHSIIINGVAFITLGHGMDSGVLPHAYFGTQRVVQDLMRNSGWKKGVVRCSKTIRDKPDGPVTGLELIEPKCNAPSQCLFQYNVNFVF